MIIDPRGMTASDWCGQMALVLDKYGTVGAIRQPPEWRAWARNVVSFPAVQLVQAPNPDDYDNWLDWAIRFCQKAESLV